MLCSRAEAGSAWQPIFVCFTLCLYPPDMVLDQHELSGPVGQDARKRIREALLKQHHHQNHKKLANRIPIVRSFADIGKKQSEPHSMDKNGEQMGQTITINVDVVILYRVGLCV